MSFSGNLEMMENSKSSALLWKFWKNSLVLLRSLISISMIITPFFLSVYIYMIPSNRKIYNIYSENSVNYFLNKGSILFKKRVFISRWKY